MKQTIAWLGCVFISVAMLAQAKPNYAPGHIQQQLKKLNVLGAALYIAAHPDDENTRLITYLANEKLVNTAYLSLTRGDGGQNLVGPELRDLLGVIRTHELLEARNLDGGRQFFTRADDFGYSKTPEETFNTWDKEKILADVVWTIRVFRPDVLITRFPPARYGYENHGHHSASAILAEEAFDAAGDPTRFPEQLKYVDVWQPRRLYWNTSSWFYKRQGVELDTTGKLKYDVGAYSPLLGQSYSELAAQSRSMHRSQGFGTALSRGEEIEWLEYVKGDSAQKDLFEGINMSWKKLPGGEELFVLFTEAYRDFNAANPAATVPKLLEAYKVMEQMPATYWVMIKKQELKQVIAACLGLYLEATSDKPTALPGQDVELSFELVNRSTTPVTVENISLFPDLSRERKDTTVNLKLSNNKKVETKLTARLPAGVEASAPYWLAEWFTNAETDRVQTLIGNPGDNVPPLHAGLLVKIGELTIDYLIPVQYKSTDPAKGEIYQPVSIVNPYLLQVPAQPIIFSNREPKTIKVTVLAEADSLNGTVGIAPPGKEWQVLPARQTIQLDKAGQTQTLEFTITPPNGQFTGDMQVFVEDSASGKRYDLSWYDLKYDHIPYQKILSPARFRVVKLDVQTRGSQIGYVMGAGDEVPEALRAMGYNVTLLEDADITAANLQQYDAVVVGIRAFNTRESLKNLNKQLWAYADSGGTVVVQYNTSHRLVTNEVAPLPIKLSRDRITDEHATMTMLAPEHPVLNTPNKITEPDLNDWVQERGLYFPTEWDSTFTPIFAGNDAGEEPLHGSLLVAPYGKGYYVYTGLSWFREMPAGVPGAYRLFANIVSLGKEE